MSEQGFHEIQLNGKQLVFLFMAATVVSVVIFLCGVMVGRGVRPAAATGPAGIMASASADGDFDEGGAAAAGDAASDPGPNSPAQAPEQAPPPVQDVDEYDFENRLTQQSATDRLRPQAPAAAPAAPAVKPEPVTPPPARAARGDKPAVEPAGSGTAQPGTYAVQLAALRDRKDADAIAQRLAGKGYSAYVVMPAPGGTPVYRVQVGRFKTRAEADKTAARLRSEGSFKPWVTK
jgi:cell division septation protein DedD